MSTVPRSLPSTGATVGLSRLLKPLGIAYGALVIFSLVLKATSSFWGALGSLFLVLGTIAAIVLAVQLILAKARVLKSKEVSLMKGLVKLVAWDPTEGVLFLKNKQVNLVDDNPHDGGGIHVIYPFLGEELALRIPLEIQTLSFRDTDVMTREYMPLTIEGTMYWKISDLSRFYLLVSKEVHTASDSGHRSAIRMTPHPQLGVAEHWLRSMAEEQTRVVVSKASTGLLVADQIAAELSKSLESPAQTPDQGASYRHAADGLAKDIREQFSTSVREYGLDIHRVALQEIKMPAEIHSAAVEACRAAYTPIKARAEAMGRKEMLQAEADVIGADAVAIREIVSNSDPLSVHDLVSQVLLDFSRKRAPGLAAAALPLLNDALALENQV